MWAWARLQAATGQSPVYYYSFRQRPPFPVGSVYDGWGASHFAALWYVFDHLDQATWSWSTADRRLAEEISSYWVNFAKSGNPNDQALPVWPAFTTAHAQVLMLGDPVAAGDVPNMATLTVLDAVYTSVRGKPFVAR